MSNQEERHGHQITTMHAVRHVFERIPGERLLGQTPDEFFRKLDLAQAKVDGMPFPNFMPTALVYKAIGGWHERIVEGDGTTALPSSMAPDVQTAHALANPKLGPQENLTAIKSYLVQELLAAQSAHAKGDVDGEFEHLGRVAHCLEDSYSNAHMFRDPTKPGDPEAEVKALLNFHPGSSSNTHQKSFDSVPTVAVNDDLARASEQAGAEALGRTLAIYVNHADLKDVGAVQKVFEGTIQSFFTGHDAVILADKHDAEFQREVAIRQENEVSQTPVVPNAAEPNASVDNASAAHPETSSMHPGLAVGSDAASVDPSHTMASTSDGDAAKAAGADQSSQGASSTSDQATESSNSATSGGQMVHPTGGVHTQVKKVTDAEGHRDYVYGQGGSDGQTAREHAANPNQPHNWQSQHGADIICPQGTPIYAAMDGTISSKFGIEKGHENDGVQSSHHGNRLTIEGASNKVFYQHLERFADGIAAGTAVHAGQLIGYSGIGGGIAHLHVAFEHGDTDQLLQDAVVLTSTIDHPANGAQNPAPHSAPADASSVPASDADAPAMSSSMRLTEASTLSASVQAGPENGRFYTAEEFRHIATNESMQFHPDMICVDPAGSTDAHAASASATAQSSILLDPSDPDAHSFAGQSMADGSVVLHRVDTQGHAAATNPSSHDATSNVVLDPSNHDAHSFAGQSMADGSVVQHAVHGQSHADNASHPGQDASSNVVIDPSNHQAQSHGGQSGPDGAVVLDPSSLQSHPHDASTEIDPSAAHVAAEHGPVSVNAADAGPAHGASASPPSGADHAADAHAAASTTGHP